MTKIIILIILNCFIFQSILQEFIPSMQYFDEVITILMFFYYLFYLKKNRFKIQKNDLKIIIICILLFFIGLLGTIRFKYQTQTIAILTDIFNFFKYIIMYLGASKISIKNIDKIFETETKIIKLFSILTFIAMIFNFIIGFNSMTYDYRYGLRSFQFIYGHAGTLNMITTFFLLILIYQLFVTKKKKYLFWILINIIILVSTLRSRAFVSAGLIIMLLYVFYIRKKNNQNYVFVILLSSVFALIIAYNQLDTYFISTTRTPRSDLLKNSIVLMNESFPTGTGYSTYGSFAASKYYSDLYYRFGFNNYYGMSEEDSQFLTDNFWPIVIAEFGLFGVIIYMFLLCTLFNTLMVRSDKNYKKITSIFIFLIMLFNSTVSSAYVHYSAVAYMFILNLILTSTKGDENIYEK